MNRIINTIVIATAITAVFASCEKEPVQEPIDPIRTKLEKIDKLIASKPASESDMKAFISHIGKHISISRNRYYFSDNSCYATDKPLDIMIQGRRGWSDFALFDDNTGMLCINRNPPLEMNSLTWKVDESDPMTIILTAEWMNEPEKYLKNPDYFEFVNNTKITLLYFRDHTAIIKGLQPFYYWKIPEYSHVPDYIISEEYCMPEVLDMQREKDIYLGFDTIDRRID